MLEWLKAQLTNGLSANLAWMQDRCLGLHGALLNSFGIVTTMAIYLTAGVLALLLLWRMVKFSFDVLRCVVIPSAAVAVVGAWLLPV